MENKRFGFLFTIIVLSTVATCIFCSSFWIDSFLKLPKMRAPYKIAFTFILSGLFLSYLAKCPVSLWKSLVFGMIAGHFSAFLSVMIANLFIPNGIERTIRSIQTFGAGDLLLLDFVAAFVLGGWLLGLILFVTIGWIVKKIAI